LPFLAFFATVILPVLLTFTALELLEVHVAFAAFAFVSLMVVAFPLLTATLLLETFTFF